MPTSDVFEQIRKEILTCELAPGSAVYEQELAQRFGISKSPVRDALLRLQEQNLVEVRARSGYRIRPISIKDACEIYEMRLLYEEACVSRAVTHATDEEIDSLRQHLTDQVNMDIREWIALNRRFHSALAAICGNSRLIEVATQLNDQVDRFTFVGLGRLHHPANFAHLNKEHAGIVAALQARDKRKALSLLRAHIERSRQRTMQVLANSAILP